MKEKHPAETSEAFVSAQWNINLKMNKLFTEDDQLWKIPTKGVLNQNIAIINFEFFHLLVFCQEILHGLIGKKDLNHPSAASWHVPGIYKIFAPVTTQYKVNVSMPMAQACWDMAVGKHRLPFCSCAVWGPAGPALHCSSLLQPWFHWPCYLAFLRHCEIRTKTLPAVHCRDVESPESAQTHLSAPTAEKGLENHGPQRPTKVPCCGWGTTRWPMISPGSVTTPVTDWVTLIQREKLIAL